jgi:hypothetical protein
MCASSDAARARTFCSDKQSAGSITTVSFPREGARRPTQLFPISGLWSCVMRLLVAMSSFSWNLDIFSCGRCWFFRRRLFALFQISVYAEPEHDSGDHFRVPAAESGAGDGAARTGAPRIARADQSRKCQALFHLGDPEIVLRSAGILPAGCCATKKTQRNKNAGWKPAPH